jgi:hypothetical protein
MHTVQTLVTAQGESWTVEHRESERLTHIGGFLMTHGDLGCITLSARLAEKDKARGREVLLNRLGCLAVGTSGVRLWHPDDAPGEIDN